MHTKGFTLIEVLIVVVILAFVALGIMALLPNGYKQVTTAGRISVLNHLGYEQIDKLKSEGYSHLDLFAGDHPTVIADRRLTDLDLKGYSLRWIVEDVSPPPANVKKVVVEAGYMIYQPNGSPFPAPPPQNQMKQQFITYITQ
jgi:prepilin-type N-terminal cleavage/methylation domain-containing protein